VESLTAIIEHEDHGFEVIGYHEFCARTGRQPKGEEPAHPPMPRRLLPAPATHPAQPELLAA